MLSSSWDVCLSKEKPVTWNCLTYTSTLFYETLEIFSQISYEGKKLRRANFAKLWRIVERFFDMWKNFRKIKRWMHFIFISEAILISNNFWNHFLYMRIWDLSISETESRDSYSGVFGCFLMISKPCNRTKVLLTKVLHNRGWTFISVLSFSSCVRSL